MRKTILPSRKIASSNRPKVVKEAVTSTRLPQLVQGWFLHSEVAGCSAATLENRRGILSKLQWFVGERKLPQVDTNALMQFFQYLRNGHTEPVGRWGNPQNKTAPSAGTVATYHRVLSAFFNWCVEQREVDVSPLDGVPKTINRPDQVQPLSEAQILTLLAAAKNNMRGERDQLIIMLLFDTGLRVSELCALKVGDVDTTRCILTVREGKGGKARYVPFAPEVKKALFRYWEEMGVDMEEPETSLFPSTRGQTAGDPMLRRGILWMLKRLAVKAGITNVRVTPHTLRHTYAIHYLRNEGDQFSLMSNLGHTSTTMTSRYVAIAQADVENKHKVSSPMTNLKKRSRKP